MKIGPKFKIARRLGERIFPKTQTTKFTISGTAKRGGAGGGGGGRRRASSDYNLQLIEKQKARYTYGLSEKQFSGYVNKSRHKAKGEPVTDLYRHLEGRLDNVIFRLGWAPSRAFARQMVVHGHVRVNGRKLNRPSYQTRPGDKIDIRPASRERAAFKDLTERLKNYQAPAWLLGTSEFQAEVKSAPSAGEAESNIDFGAVIEFYSRV